VTPATPGEGKECGELFLGRDGWVDGDGDGDDGEDGWDGRRGMAMLSTKDHIGERRCKAICNCL